MVCSTAARVTVARVAGVASSDGSESVFYASACSNPSTILDAGVEAGDLLGGVIGALLCPLAVLCTEGGSTGRGETGSLVSTS